MNKHWLLIICLLPLIAHAEIKGVYQVKGGGTMTLAYQDSEHMRMDTGPDNYMLVQGDKTYMVQRKGDGWTAMDLSAMKGAMQGAMQGMGNQQPEPSQPAGEQDYGFQDTGRTETVAGYEGKVYEVRDPDGSTTEVVISEHEDIRELSRAWMQFSRKNAENMGFGGAQAISQAFTDNRINKMGGLLRAGDSMTLKSVSTSVGGDYFSLPAGTQVQKMPNMQDFMGGNGQSGAGQDASDFMNERQDTAEQEMRREMEKESDKQIKKGVNKMMDGLFGG
jgi:hypothetical protein